MLHCIGVCCALSVLLLLSFATLGCFAMGPVKKVFLDSLAKCVKKKSSLLFLFFPQVHCIVLFLNFIDAATRPILVLFYPLHAIALSSSSFIISPSYWKSMRIRRLSILQVS